MNDAFVRRLARGFAERVRRDAGDDAGAQARCALRLAYCRPPGAEELALARRFLAANPDGLIDLCHVLFTTNEFTHVD
jgi:hypothetical protein